MIPVFPTVEEKRGMVKGKVGVDWCYANLVGSLTATGSVHGLGAQ